ncbi:unnamed protein product [Nesidiocoris tenuis]|uniref:C2H2-type domain-containing protein n=1 Tax=Nesidiocoris tenuis TaxID=355587 RepID=A0A6H5HFE6_9HEMI|nr:unnamed protein product [Nesidiocoris tenuis]
MIKLELKLNLKQKLINHIQTRNYSQTYGVVSYDMPKDATWTPGQDLSDVTYDGHINENTLEDGLGRLVDGTYGGDNFKMDVGVGKGNGWVGWKNESFPKKYIELVFEFDTLRNFSLVNIFTNNCFSKEVQTLRRVERRIQQLVSYCRPNSGQINRLEDFAKPRTASWCFQATLFPSIRKPVRNLQLFPLAVKIKNYLSKFIKTLNTVVTPVVVGGVCSCSYPRVIQHVLTPEGLQPVGHSPEESTTIFTHGFRRVVAVRRIVQSCPEPSCLLIGAIQNPQKMKMEKSLSQISPSKIQWKINSSISRNWPKSPWRPVNWKRRRKNQSDDNLVFLPPLSPQAFADRSNLRAHVQTHSSKKPHTCERCGKSFALKSYLYKHEESSCLKNHAPPSSDCRPGSEIGDDSDENRRPIVIDIVDAPLSLTMSTIRV